MLGLLVLGPSQSGVFAQGHTPGRDHPHSRNGHWSASGEGQWHWSPQSPRSGFSDRWQRWRLPLPSAETLAPSGAYPSDSVGLVEHQRAKAVLEIGNPFVPMLALALYGPEGQRIDSLEPFGNAFASPVRIDLRTLGGTTPDPDISPFLVVERPDPLYQIPISWVPQEGAWLDLWVRGEGANRVFPVTLWTPERLARRQGARLGVMAGFLAVLLAVLVFGILFSTVVRTDFGWPYLLWVASGMAYLIVVSGLGYAYAYPLQYPLHRILPVLFGNATAWSLLLVLQRLYRTQPLYPILHRLIELARLLLLAFTLLHVLFVWLGPTATRRLFFAQETLWLLVSFLVLIAPLAFAVRRKHPESPLLFLALGPLAIGVGMETLENMGLLAWPFRTQVLHWIGTASAVLFTAPILLFRIRRKIEEGFQWEGRALIRRRLDAFVLFQREANLRENLQQAVADRLGPLMQEVEEGLDGLGRTTPDASTTGVQGGNPASLDPNALRQARERLSAAKAELRVIAENRLPTELERQNLGPALEGLAEPLRAAGLTVDIRLSGFESRWSADPIIRMALFRTAQGLLSNVLQHAQAQHCRLRLTRLTDALELVVEDDGIGLKPEQTQAFRSSSEHPLTPRGRGMDILRQRVHALGGSVRWTTPQTKRKEEAHMDGTRCVVHIPIQI